MTAADRQFGGADAAAMPVDFDAAPLYLAPMAGVTDSVFRGLCKEFGADVVVTEFVSAEGIFRRNARTVEYLEFEEGERPLGIQLFGADPGHLAEAARLAVEWKRPDFIDLNFGCPVNKVVARHGGSALLRDCPLLERVARAVSRAVAPVPVTAKIRIGWDRESINAPETARILEGCGIRAIAVHGRTRSQGYSGEACWDTIAAVAAAVRVPVIGNGDISSGRDAARRLRETGVRGLMIGRAAMARPWIFREIKAFLATGQEHPPPDLAGQWAFVIRHCRLAVARAAARAPAGTDPAAVEAQTVRAFRARLMAYSRGMPGARHLRERLGRVASLADLEGVAEESLAAAPAGATAAA